MTFERVAWSLTVLVALITALLLLLSGYNGYAGLGLAVAISAAINLRLSHSSSARAARPRWLIASFCSSLSSAIVRAGGPPNLSSIRQERGVVAKPTPPRGMRRQACPCSEPRTRAPRPACGST